MAFELATAFVRVGTQLSPLKAGLASAKNMVTGSLSKFSGLIAGIGGLLGGIGLGAVVNIAAAGQELSSMFDAVFKEGSDDARAFSTELAMRLGRSVGDVMGQMAGFQDLFVPLGFARGEAKELSKQMTTLAQDVGSFKNVKPDLVARDFTSALVGNHEAARKYGIVITETTLKAKLAEMGMDKLTGAALEQAKVQARLQLIYAGTSDAHGDAERTAGSFTNRMLGLKGAIKDTAGDIGAALLPALAEMAKKLTDMVRSFQTWMKPFLNTVKTLSSNITLIWEIMVDSAAIQLQRLQNMWNNFPEWIQSVIENASARVQNAWQDMFAGMTSSYEGFHVAQQGFWDQTIENVMAGLQGREAADLSGNKNRIEQYREATRKLGFALGAGDEKLPVPEITDLFADNGELDALQNSLNEKMSRLFLEVNEAGHAAEEAAKRKTSDTPTLKVGKVELPKGTFGFADLANKMQDAFLKGEDPAKQQVGLMEKGNAIGLKTLDGINKLVANDNKSGAKLRVAT